MKQTLTFFKVIFLLTVTFSAAPAQAETKTPAPAETNSENTFVAKRVGKKSTPDQGTARGLSETAAPQTDAASEASAPATAAAPASTSGEPAPAGSEETLNVEPPSAATFQDDKPDEPNFVVVDGRVVPNPRKNAQQAQAAAASGPQEEPNFIVVNGQVVRNPNKKDAAL